MNDQKYYILKDKKVAEVERDEYTKWNKKNYPINEARRVALYQNDVIRISTVFAGDFGSHRAFMPDPTEEQDTWFETLVVGVPELDEFYYYVTFDEALKGHNELVATIRNNTNKNKCL